MSVGVIDGEPRLDLMYEEDVRAETDMNVVVTGGGDFVEVQGTAEGAPFRRDELDALLDLALAGCADLARFQTEALAGVSRRILLASRNAKKLTELRRILAPALPDVEVIGLDDVAAYDEVPETGATFAENALIKAREGYRHTGLPTVADDSGLAVDALNGMPGVLSARWAGAHGDDEANLRLVLDQVADVPDERLGAAFVCAVAYVDGTDEILTDGRMPGRLIREPRGTNGFGYDPIFVPDGHDRTSAELSTEAKDAISHRGQALRALAARLAADSRAPTAGDLLQPCVRLRPIS